MPSVLKSASLRESEVPRRPNISDFVIEEIQGVAELRPPEGFLAIFAGTVWQGNKTKFMSVIPLPIIPLPMTLLDGRSEIQASLRDAAFRLVISRR
jgi:hypothetical protein